MNSPEILNLKDTCTACGACVNVCGTKSIELSIDEEGFLMPRIRMDLCTHCGLCDKACHILSGKVQVDSFPMEGYAGWSLDKKLVYESSSGGMFSVLSEQVLNDLGVVFGASYNYKKKRLEQTSTEECDLTALRKSKYIESHPMDSYSKVKEYLKKGRSVMYCGTPCQILGLKRYLEVLKVSTEKLLLVDFICHGVPSNEHFSQYLKKMERGMGSEIVHVDFRSKLKGWSGISMVSEYRAGNGKVKRNVAYQEDPFHLAFYEGILLRRSCYSCKAIHEHASDITIADFWGRTGVIKDDDTGISLLIANSEKGKNRIEGIQKNPEVYLQRLAPEQYSYAYERRKQEYSRELRDQVVKELQEKGFVKVINQRYRYPISIYKLKSSVKKMIRYKQ